MSIVREWRKDRDRAGILLYLVGKAGFSKRAWSIYNKWLKYKISYREAKKKLEKLAGIHIED